MSLFAADPTALAAVATALLDVQHYSPALLTAAAGAAQQTLGALSPADVAALLLAVAFFRVPSHDFVQTAFQVLSAIDVAAVSHKTLVHVFQAVVLLQAQGIEAPAPLMQVDHCGSRLACFDGCLVFVHNAKARALFNA